MKRSQSSSKYHNDNKNQQYWSNIEENIKRGIAHWVEVRIVRLLLRFIEGKHINKSLKRDNIELAYLNYKVWDDSQLTRESDCEEGHVSNDLERTEHSPELLEGGTPINGQWRWEYKTKFIATLLNIAAFIEF